MKNQFIWVIVSDATATAMDIVNGATAYVNGQKITGTVHEITGDYVSICNGSNFIDFHEESPFVCTRSTLSSDYNFLFRKNSSISIRTPTSYFGDATAADVVAGKTFTSSAGLKVTGTATISGYTPTLQTKSVTPTESEQVVGPDAGYDGLSSVTVGSIPSNYIGSGVTTKSAATITPTTTDQTIDAGQYLAGAQTIQGDANLIPANIASGVSIFGVTGTHQGGGGTDTSDATATKVDIINGKTAYINGGKVTGTLVVQNYYTGSIVPESSLGNDGDLYFKV